MSLSSPKQLFGIHSVAFLARASKIPYGILKVLASSSLNFSGTLVPVSGGSNKSPYAVEEGKISSQLNLKTREYPDFLFELFGGAITTPNSVDASGAVSTLANVKGTTAKSATIGVASIAVKSGSETDLKFGKYVIEVVTSTTVRVYCTTDADFGSGTSKVYTDDTLNVVATTLTVVASTATTIPGFGLEITGGSGTIGMTVGDTCEFEVMPKNTATTIIEVGKVAATFPEFSAVIYGKKRGSGELVEVECPKVKGEGVPVMFEEDKWSEADIKCMVMYDSTLDYVYRMRTVARTTPT